MLTREYEVLTSYSLGVKRGKFLVNVNREGRASIEISLKYVEIWVLKFLKIKKAKKKNSELFRQLERKVKSSKNVFKIYVVGLMKGIL